MSFLLGWLLIGVVIAMIFGTFCLTGGREDEATRRLKRKYRAKLFSAGMVPARYQFFGYFRMANAATLYVWPIYIIWRMPWLKRPWEQLHGHEARKAHGQ